MKKILFASYILNARDAYFCEYLVKFLINQKYLIKIISNKRYIAGISDIYEENMCQNADLYDLILAYNKQGFKFIKSYRIEKPIFYLCNSDDLYKEHIERNKYSELFLSGRPKIFIDNNCYCLLNTFFTETHNNEHKKDYLVIAVNSITTIQKLTPLLNTLFAYRIYIISIKDYISFKYINPNIHIVNNRNKIDDLFRDAQLIIADDQSVIRGILLKKPVLLVGQYGYGGLITNENFDLLYRYGFSGRPGGNFGEYLPYDLITYDIQEAHNILDNELELIRRRLIIKLEGEYSSLIRKIDYYIELRHSKIHQYMLVKNPIYSIISNEVSNSCYLINNITNQMLYDITAEECSYLIFFETPHHINDFKNEIYKLNMETLNELISLKILIYDTEG